MPTVWGWRCDLIASAGDTAIAEFICRTVETRKAFGHAFLIFVDRIKEGRFGDTNAMFEPPGYDLRVTAVGAPAHWTAKALAVLRPIFDSKTIDFCAANPEVARRLTQGCGSAGLRGDEVGVDGKCGNRILGMKRNARL
jgi:hypothetical protein